jgi:hypothetical protein
VDDLDRLFQRLVQVLTERGPDRLGQPVQVAELYQDLVPYRQHRLALKLDTHQDYEAAVLRLLAGERGYARVEPEEAQQAFATELQATLPDAGVIHEFAAARVVLDLSAARRLLAGSEAYAPPTLHPAPPDGAPSPPPLPGRSRATEEDVEGAVEGAAEEPCPYCDAELPKGRVLFYCPFCGGNLKGVRCPDCGTELEVGWLYCITCGRKMGGE